MPSTNLRPESTTVWGSWSWTEASLWESLGVSGTANTNSSAGSNNMYNHIPNLPAAATDVTAATHYYYMKRGGAQTPYVKGIARYPSHVSASRGPLAWTWYGDAMAALDTVAEANSVEIGCQGQAATQTDTQVGQCYATITYVIPEAAVFQILLELLPPLLFGGLAGLLARDFLAMRRLVTSRRWASKQRQTWFADAEWSHVPRLAKEHRARSYHLAPSSGLWLPERMAA